MLTRPLFPGVTLLRHHGASQRKECFQCRRVIFINQSEVTAKRSHDAIEATRTR